MYFKDTSNPGNSSVKVSLDSEHWVKISTLVDADKQECKTCVWLYQGEESEGASSKAMFTIEPLQDDLYLMAFGGAGDAVFDSFGTYRECLERAFATFKNSAQVL